MNDKEESFAHLEQSLKEIGLINPAEDEWITLLLAQIETSITICRHLKDLSITRDQEQLINYCLTKFDHARQLAEHFDREESIEFFKNIIRYLLKTLTREDQEEDQ